MRKLFSSFFILDYSTQKSLGTLSWETGNKLHEYFFSSLIILKKFDKL